jgi:hypothetical protein
VAAEKVPVAESARTVTTPDPEIATDWIRKADPLGPVA